MIPPTFNTICFNSKKVGLSNEMQYIFIIEDTLILDGCINRNQIHY